MKKKSAKRDKDRVPKQKHVELMKLVPGIPHPNGKSPNYEGEPPERGVLLGLGGDVEGVEVHMEDRPGLCHVFSLRPEERLLLGPPGLPLQFHEAEEAPELVG